jgi:predicted TIM-barrel fold metal-dependent hydrolase
VVTQNDLEWWMCDGAMLGPSGLKMLGDYNATTRAGIEDDGFRASTPALRMQDMDRDGIRASVIYGPSLFGLPIADQELKAACLRTYNDWADEFNAHDRARLCVLPVLPTHTPAAAVAELERVATLGHRGAIISPFEFRVSDPEWDRLWAVAAETRLPISFHIGFGTSQVKVAYMSWEMAAFSAVAPMQLDEPLALMIFSGALERHPDMRLVLAECVLRRPHGPGRRQAPAQGHRLSIEVEAQRDLPPPGLRHLRGGALRPAAHPHPRPRQLHVGVGLPAPGFDLPTFRRRHRRSLRRPRRLDRSQGHRRQLQDALSLSMTTTTRSVRRSAGEPVCRCASSSTRSPAHRLTGARGRSRAKRRSA